MNASSSLPAYRERTGNLVTAALLAALLAACAFLVLPIEPVPVTFQVFVVCLAALLLRPAWAFASVGVFLLLGAVGVPVFAGGTAGFGVIAGPTGGYLIGFALAALAGAAVRVGLELTSLPQVAADAAAVTVTIIAIYAVGATWLAVSTGMGWAKALAAGVAPFVVADIVKAAVAILAARLIRRAIGR